MKRITAMILATLMLCMAFAGCGDKKAEANDPNAITMEVYKGGIRYAEAVMQQNYGLAFRDYLAMEMGDGTTGGDFILQNTKDMFREFESVKLLAKEKGVTVSDEDKKSLDDNKKAMIEEMGGEEAFKSQLEMSGMTEEFFDYVSYAQLVYSNVYEKLFGEGGELALTADSIVASATEKNLFCVKHVLVQTAADAEDFADKKALADDIAKRASEGEDFEALVTEYGEDPGMQSYPHGYVMDKDGFTLTGGQMVPEFATASAALEVGGVSAPVQTDYGFHIIKRYPIDAEYVGANLDAFANEFSQLRMTELLTEYLDKVEVVYPEGHENVDLFELFGVDPNAAAGGIEEGTAAPADAAPEVTVEPVEAAPEVTVEPADAAPAE